MIHTVDDITAQWLSRAIGHDVVGVKASRIGTGQIGEVHRLDLQYGDRTRPGPKSLVAKIASNDETSKMLGAAGLYEREVRFYKEVAPVLSTAPIATPIFVEQDSQTGDFCILLRDATPATVGCDIKGATLEEAKLAMSELGRLHSLVLNHITLEQHPNLKKPRTWDLQERMVPRWEKFLERYGERIKPEHQKIGQQFMDNFDAYQQAQLASAVPQGLVHGDYRLDNILFGTEGGQPLTLVDWQTCYWGPILHDLSFFLGLALTPEFRRQHQEELVKIYQQSVSVSSPRPISIQDCNLGIQMQSFTGMRQAITAAIVVERTDRGDELFLTMFERSCELVIDTKALDVLPSANPPDHLEPEPSDEEMHPFGDNPLHNESWYFDVADPEQEIGVWVRLGVTPHQKGSWYHALLCGPNVPTVGVIDFECPHPGKDLTVHGAEYIATNKAENPLKDYRVTVKGKGKAFDDPADIMKGETGRDVDVQMDLLYETDGHPYQWRKATRYEIPCKVTGTFSWEDKTVTFTKARGQRDHSWGPRDWWSADWVWSAFHFDDGTHTHHVNARIPKHGQFGVGYVQKAGEKLIEMTDVRATEKMAENGLGIHTTITMAPLPLVFDITPIGHAPLHLKANDGRIARFPRSWVKVKTNDGRNGVGWIEWNLN